MATSPTSGGSGPGRYDVLCETVNRIGRRTLEFGVQACFHPHVGSAVETREQIGRVFDNTDPAVLFFCLDTGHVAKGGSDVLELLATYRCRIPYVHLKDVDDQGRFVELGKGRVNLPGFFRALREGGYAGWFLPEVPVSAATGPTPEALAAYDLAYLRCQLVPLWSRNG